jgi:FeS assembly SUF system protein
MSITSAQMDAISSKLVETFKSVYDPEIPVDIYELGLIYDAFVNEEGFVKVLMTLTTPNCPVAESMPQEVKDRVLEMEGVVDAEVELTFDPPWDRDMMSEEAKFELGFL